MSDAGEEEGGEVMTDEDFVRALEQLNQDEDSEVGELIKMMNENQMISWDEAQRILGDTSNEPVKSSLPEQTRPTEPDNDTNVDDCIRRLLDNDPSLVEINLNNMKRTPIPQIKRLVEAVAYNTTLEKLSLANLGLYDGNLEQLPAVLELNSTLRCLNLETNYLSGEFFSKLFKATLANQTLEECKAVNQGVSFATTAEKDIIESICANRGLIKVSINLRLPEGRNKIENTMLRNGEIRRVLRREAAARAKAEAEAAAKAAPAEKPKPKFVPKPAPAKPKEPSPPRRPLNSDFRPKTPVAEKKEPAAAPVPAPKTSSSTVAAKKDTLASPAKKDTVASPAKKDAVTPVKKPAADDAKTDGAVKKAPLKKAAAIDADKAAEKPTAAVAKTASTTVKKAEAPAAKEATAEKKPAAKLGAAAKAAPETPASTLKKASTAGKSDDAPKEEKTPKEPPTSKEPQTSKAPLDRKASIDKVSVPLVRPTLKKKGLERTISQDQTKAMVEKFDSKVSGTAAAAAAGEEKPKKRLVKKKKPAVDGEEKKEKEEAKDGGANEEKVALKTSTSSTATTAKKASTAATKTADVDKKPEDKEEKTNGDVKKAKAPEKEAEREEKKPATTAGSSYTTRPYRRY